MGEVYRARDTRLAREVAIKVLPESLASDPERLKRFEKEARSASALNHPNIVTIHDIGSEGGVSYIAMELVDGTTLREQLASGPLPIKKLLQIAPQVADGLARAHEAGIVHRDLKPENVMVKKDGLVKILDFGLAKLSSTGSGSDEASQLPTMTGTQPGVVVGTVSYMSPEQASGQTVDFRSDQFSLGSMLYEMATGKRAFQKKTAIDTLSAILNEEPQATIGSINPQAPAPLRWIVARSLAKEPRERYASTEDLARELASVRDHLSELSSGFIVESPVKRASETVGFSAPWVWPQCSRPPISSLLRQPAPAPIPRFQKVTFQQGAIWRARFAPDGQTVVYAMVSAGDDLKPAELYSTRVGSLDSRSLGLPPADILSISRAGQMALALVKDPLIQDAGTLAEASLTGGMPRPILDDVWAADWSRDGKELAVVHIVDGKQRIEYPVGNVLYESTNYIASVRVSPDGESVAFVEWTEVATLRVVDRRKAVRTLVKDAGVTFLASWSPRGDELWWLKQHNVSLVQSTEVHAVTLTGKERVVASLPGAFNLCDLAGDGRLLVEHVTLGYKMVGRFPGEPAERNLDWLDQSTPGSLSADGKMLIFGDREDAESSKQGAYLRKTDGSPAVHLGEGSAGPFSPDGKWALVCRKLPRHYLVLIPVGAGQERVLAREAPVPNGHILFHPDGKRVLFEAAEPGKQERVYEQSIDGGPPKALTPEGMGLVLVSPDGTLLMTRKTGAKDVQLFHWIRRPASRPAPWLCGPRARIRSNGARTADPSS